MSSEKPQSAVNWEAVWKSLNWDDERRQRDTEQERLRQRARHYAEPVKEAEIIPENAHTVLVFDLGGERYGIDVMVVRGIRSLGRLARVPGVPPYYQGVINVRGQLRSVLDLRGFFQIHYEEEMIVPDEVVIVHAGMLEMALLAHQVIGVETIPPAAIKSVDHMPYTIGITRERLILLDVEALFADERLIIGGARE